MYFLLLSDLLCEDALNVQIQERDFLVYLMAELITLNQRLYQLQLQTLE